MTRMPKNTTETRERIATAVLAGALIGSTGAFADVAPSVVGPGSRLHYQLTDLGTLGGQRSVALALNNQGTIVGWAETDPVTEVRAFRHRQGAMIDLGTLGGTWSAARDVNELDQIVGISGTAGGGTAAAYWYENVMYDLNDIIDNIVRADPPDYDGAGAGPGGPEAPSPARPASDGRCPTSTPIPETPMPPALPRRRSRPGRSLGRDFPDLDADPGNTDAAGTPEASIPARPFPGRDFPDRDADPGSTDAAGTPEASIPARPFLGRDFPDRDADPGSTDAAGAPEASIPARPFPGRDFPDRDADPGSTDAAGNPEATAPISPGPGQGYPDLDADPGNTDMRIFPDTDAAGSDPESAALFSWLNSLVNEVVWPNTDAALPDTDAAPTAATHERTDPDTDTDPGAGLVRAPLRHVFEANAINDQGYIAASAWMWADDNPHAILLIPSQDSSLADPRYSYLDLGELDGALDSSAFDLNEEAEVVGRSGGAAFHWKAGVMYSPTGFGNVSQANAINDNGVLVGSTGTSFSHQAATVWFGNAQYDLDAVGGGFSEALGINNQGQIVGRMMPTVGNSSFAMYWDETLHSFDLNDVTTLPAFSFISRLAHAAAIDESGSIVGYGESSDGIQRAFLLTRTDVPPKSDMR